MVSLRERWRWFLASPDTEENRALWLDIRARQPGFVEAVLADARATAAYRGDRFETTGALDQWLQVVRLAVVTDAFLGQVLYRAKVALQRRRVPLLPRLLQRWMASSTGMFIGDPVVIAPGLHVPHGQVVVDGITTIDRGVVLYPFVTIGLVAGQFGGPTIGRGVKVGTGAKVLGPVTVGPDATIGANAVVVRSVAAEHVVAGVPARVVRSGPSS